MIQISDILKEIERIAPLSLQEGFDNAGLQVGDVNRTATGAVLCLDVTEGVIDEAISAGCNLIISHHPLIFKPLKSLSGNTYIERCVMKACRNEIVIYSAHTNLDNATEGVNYKLASLLNLQNISILSPQKGKLLKLSTFVPVSSAETVRIALFDAGAGNIGNYDMCSFNTQGTGTFRPSEKTNPYCGVAGELHHEDEVRIETILPSFLKAAVTRALLSAHPYEEPAFDFYPLDNVWNQVGSGIAGELEQAEDELSFLQKIKNILNVASVRHSALTGRTVRKIAICGGSGAFLIPETIACGADIFITGEAKYNDFLDVEDKILLAVVGHYESEICTKELFYDILSKKFPTFAVQISNTDNPVKYL
ncbi:MAG: Nif3-like dinuclear metal center hexameric protein [Tannerella sp.]|jgi:dinuclear metal center YbgI/SA1388 family protein|nr:Nif3-like dinuclear metal center hexameric protein [Tannerella sp.]